jgi:hypothetical protein
MGEDGRAVALDMFIEPDAGAGLGHDRCKRGLADLKRIAPQVVLVRRRPRGLSILKMLGQSEDRSQPPDVRG